MVGAPLGEPLPPDNLPAASDERQVDLGIAASVADRRANAASRAATLLDKLALLSTQASPRGPATQAAGLLLRHCCPALSSNLRISASTPPWTAKDDPWKRRRVTLDVTRGRGDT